MTAAVAIGVAVCAATSAMPAAALPFTEATASDAAAQDADTTTAARLQIEAGSEIIGSGATGFLASDTDGDVRWTRYADGSSTVLATERGQPKTTERYGALSDTVFTPAFNQETAPAMSRPPRTTWPQARRRRSTCAP
ncbi:hypothetical protein ACFQ60_46780 [Streptomyces zhihengii]